MLAPAAHYPSLHKREELEILASLLIREHLADSAFSLEELAQTLCMSPRSLQRKLAVQGLSFSVLRDRERARVVTEKMEAGMSKEAIGALLGYTDLSSIYKFLAKNPPLEHDV
ncbi:DNA-binding transcriptional regulator AraC [compost metagenome]